MQRSIGGYDSLGSIGFSQIQTRFKYGKEHLCAGLASVNLYHPEDAVKGFAIWSNEAGLGEGFRRAFVTNVNMVTKQYGDTFPRIGATYTDQAADRLSKGLMAYNTGAFLAILREQTWPEMLKNEPVHSGIRYALSIKSAAGISLANRKWTWTDKQGETVFTFDYSEQDWWNGTTWQQKRDAAAPQ
jgi:hypothetical protein